MHPLHPPTPTPLKKQFPISNSLRGEFVAAYIEPVYLSELYSVVPFKLHLDPDSVGSTDDQVSAVDSDQYWAATAIMAYQPIDGFVIGLLDSVGDLDPNFDDSILFGYTPEGSVLSSLPGYLVINMESIREGIFEGGLEDYSLSTIEEYQRRIIGVVAHELGHMPQDQLPGNDHKEEGIMKIKAVDTKYHDYGPSTIKRFRMSTSWTD